MVQNIPINEKLYIRGDLNEHVRVCCSGYENVYENFGYETRNTKRSPFWILHFHMICGLVTHDLRI